MTPQTAIAYAFCNYEATYRKLQVKPHYYICMAAKQSPNHFYRQDLEMRAPDQGLDVTRRTYYWTGDTADWLAEDLEPTETNIYPPLSPFLMWDDGQRIGTNFEYSLDSGIIERYVRQRFDLLRKLEVLSDG
ncbi:hypothetical protein BBP40_001581 [Aspergillus hancockii]|nr:hypothetical protein BBP40_001581 [Aspergillus hancockii]